MGKKTAQIIAWILLGVGGVISIFFIVSAYRDGVGILGPSKIDFGITGQFGDFIGGIVGTIISAAGFIFLYLTLKEQRESVAKERFESKFFDLIKLHRDNVNELRYSNQSGSDDETVEGRRVFRIIFLEFLDCLKEVRNYSSTKSPDDYITARYRQILEKIIQPINPRIDLYEFATIDIAFCIVFFGLGEEGEVVLKRIFSRKYVHPHINKLIRYLQVKPKKKYASEYKKWIDLKSLVLSKRVAIIDELHEKRFSDASEAYSEEAANYKTHGTYDKYYGGHQHRLGHYFRHLFQCYKFLNAQGFLSEDEKYFYGKTLRAQLSTYEQALLFIDSISSLGFKWEFTPEYVFDEDLAQSLNEKTKNDQKLITKYNLIKNLPGDRYLDIKYKDYYPLVEYESDEVNIS